MGQVIPIDAARQARKERAMRELVEALCEADFFRLGHCDDIDYHPSEPEFTWWQEKARELYATYPECRRSAQHIQSNWPEEDSTR